MGGKWYWQQWAAQNFLINTSMLAWPGSHPFLLSYSGITSILLPLLIFTNTPHIKSSAKLAGIDLKKHHFQGDIGQNLCQDTIKPRCILVPRSWRLHWSCSPSACWSALTDLEGDGGTLWRNRSVFSLFPSRVMHPLRSLQEARQGGLKKPTWAFLLIVRNLPETLDTFTA